MIIFLIGDCMSKLKKVAGVGFSGLDIIRTDQDYYFPGGTCANVLTVLSSLGCSSRLMKAAYDNPWNSYINELLANKGVRIIEYGRAAGPIPRVIQVNTAGTHFFYTTCPKCKKKLIGIKLLTDSNARCLAAEILDVNLLFYDRISSGIKVLSNIARENQIWSFYEPNSCRVFKQLYQNAASADILKFSVDRISLKQGTDLKAALSVPESNTKLIIVTLGERGIAYSIKEDSSVFSQWYHIDALPVKNQIADTSGAGDWLTAGFINSFLEVYPQTCKSISKETVHFALLNSQILSVENCMYIGALGAFYASIDKRIALEGVVCPFCLSNE